jgi:hypothetical protein
MAAASCGIRTLPLLRWRAREICSAFNAVVSQDCCRIARSSLHVAPVVHRPPHRQVKTWVEQSMIKYASRVQFRPGLCPIGVRRVHACRQTCCYSPHLWGSPCGPAPPSPFGRAGHSLYALLIGLRPGRRPVAPVLADSIPDTSAICGLPRPDRLQQFCYQASPTCLV